MMASEHPFVVSGGSMIWNASLELNCILYDFSLSFLSHQINQFLLKLLANKVLYKGFLNASIMWSEMYSQKETEYLQLYMPNSASRWLVIIVKVFYIEASLLLENDNFPWFSIMPSCWLAGWRT